MCLLRAANLQLFVRLHAPIRTLTLHNTTTTLCKSIKIVPVGVVHKIPKLKVAQTQKEHLFRPKIQINKLEHIFIMLTRFDYILFVRCAR